MNPIAVSGKSRIGKSTFLRHCFEIDRKVLKVDSGDRPVTEGIDMVIEPIYIDREGNNMKVNILDS